MSYPPPPPQDPYGSYGSYGYGPPANHKNAVLALILGIVSLIFCSLCGPFAWVIGKRAVDEIDASGGRIGGRGLAQAGYICGIVGTAFLAISIVVIIIVFGVAANSGT